MEPLAPPLLFLQKNQKNMCGIVAYIGQQEAYPILIKGLKRLEYRGYDSAGVAVLNGALSVHKQKGKVADLEKVIGEKTVCGKMGIAHTRWATHGEPNTQNAHPHLSNSGQLALIHNGIIENYGVLKQALVQKGYTFRGQTDSEVLVNWIEEMQFSFGLSLPDAIHRALQEVKGAYAIVVIDKDDPTQMVAARKGSPLAIGMNEEGCFLASDASPIVEYTNRILYLGDEEIAVVNEKGIEQIYTLDKIAVEPVFQEINLVLEELEKGDYDHFMQKEIFEQPDTITNAQRGRVNAQLGDIKIGGYEEQKHRMLNASRIIITGCGTSWHSGLVGKYLIEELVGIPTVAEYASEWRYRKPVINDNDVVIALSQSGETADTLAAISLAKERGALTYGIVNSPGSSISRITDAGTYLYAGPEIGVASTKAFTGQVMVLSMLAIKMAFDKGTISKNKYQSLIYKMQQLPALVQKSLEKNAQIKYIAGEIKDASNTLFLGRGYNFPVALEGALKLKEISYIHAEGYPAAEMKHGPIALIDENMPVIVIATSSYTYDKLVSNIQEAKTRKGLVIAVINEGDTVIPEIADFCIEIPATDELLSPILSVIPLQLLSYHIAKMRGCNVDQPRNLAKSVTVE